MNRYRFSDPERLPVEELVARIEPYSRKFAWFLGHGYAPHYYQSLFHSMTNPATGRLARYRNLAAGRRGGKTYSAAEEVVYYAAHPEEWHRDMHGLEDDRPLHIWGLVPEYTKAGRAAVLALREVLRKAGLLEGRDYKENRGERLFEFSNDTLLEFKTATDPDRLIGAGLDLLWIDEAGAISDDEAWNYVRPALADKQGGVITTTTPRGKNWYWETFFGPAIWDDPKYGSVEYRSIDNPAFAREEWVELQKTYHPLMFRQEFMASFDSMAGVALSGDWLLYYDLNDLPKKDGKLDLHKYIAVDPATGEGPDSFAMALIGITKDGTQAYLLKTFLGKIPFPDQVQLVHRWFLEHRPMMIGVEANAFQRVMAQQIERIPGFPPVVPVFSKGKKEERILSMSPWFKIGKVRIHQSHKDFIDQWLNYDPEAAKPKDDLLDAVNIALQLAGTLLPVSTPLEETDFSLPAADINELARRHRQSGGQYGSLVGVDDNLGGEW